MRRTRLTLSLSVLFAGVAVAACVGAPSDSRITIDAPDRSQFDPVGLFLDHRCGSLDCHGSAQRNLVLWGNEGLRLNPSDVPGVARTSEAELDASYRSLVGLEPAVMSEVVEGGGHHPELLTFVRKARGDESHKGGALVVPGDVQDTCIASWLQNNTDTMACLQARQMP